MKRLSGLDATFLYLETSCSPMHVSGVFVVDPSTAPGGFSFEGYRQMVADRLHLAPPWRRRLAEVPFGLHHPLWIEDPDFDLDFHVRELGLARPGTDRQLAEQVARIASRPLDRKRPLWELYVIHGLESGHVAVLTKIHHAVIDGMSGAEIMGLLLDLSPEGRELPDAPDNRLRGRPSDLSMLARGLAGVPQYPFRALKALPSAVPNIEETPFGVIPGAPTLGKIAGALTRATGLSDELPSREKMVAPKTKFSGRLSPHRRFAFGQLPLDEVKAMKNLHGVTVNDVVVSICAGAVRRWLLEHDDVIDQPLVAQIPVSVRKSDEIGTYGNRIMLMSAPLFTDIADPIERLQRTHESLDVMKERHRAMPAELLQDANHFIPPAVFSRAARLTFRLSTSQVGRPTWNLVISNVPGPQFPLYMAGAKLVANYPVSVITHGMGLNITVMSYMGHLDFGIVADRDQMPDLWNLMEWLEDELDALKPVEKKKAPRARKPSPAPKRKARSKA